ncbi:MAG: tetraacyldisaccharide 4'-kinase [Bacteroidales bacterium]|nr:tetraacyldisaccharide 4'-kinase [Bacteroidales bacterium]
MLGLISKIRNQLFDKGIFKSSEFDLPIINVGNLAVGGSGKTPHVEYLIRLLKQEFKVATLSRGYGRNTRGFREVKINDKASESGDEPLQIKKHFPDINVFVGEKRVEAVSQLLFEHSKIEAIILDDAYQHRAIKAGFNILLTDYSKIFPDDKIMPSGRLREHPLGANRADLIIVTKCPMDLTIEKRKELQNKISNFSHAPTLYSGINYQKTLVPIFSNRIDIKTGINIILVSGIAKSLGFEEYVKEAYKPKSFEHFNFRDHYHFKKSDLQHIEEKFNTFANPKIILCTDKDAVRLSEVAQGNSFAKLPVYRLPIEVAFLGNDKKIFDKKITDYVRQNKANFTIHSEQD